MAIEITLPAPDFHIGPGFTVRLHSDFIGPLPTNSQWALTVSLDPEGAQQVDQVFVPALTTTAVFTLNQPDQGGIRYPNWVAQPGAPVRVLAQLLDPEGVQIDSTSIASTWQPSSMLWQQLQLKPTGGGLTTTEKQQLTDTERRTQLLGEPSDLVVQHPSGPLPTTIAEIFSRSTLDRLTLTELTPGPSCAPVRFTFSVWFTAVIIRVTTIAPDLVPKTPDGEWYFPDLAVLRVFRGADLEFRRGIHTPTFLQEKPWQWGWQFLNQIPILGTPPDVTVMVDWREGCCGQVFLMAAP